MSPSDPARLQAERAALRARLAELDRLLAPAGVAEPPPAGASGDALLALVRDAVVVIDLDGSVTFWNSGAERIFGWAAAEMLGRSILDRYPPETRAAAAAALAQASAGAPLSGEWEDFRKDGSRVWVESRVQLIADDSGAPRGVLALYTDISARKRAELALRESEQLLRLIVETSLESVVLTDRERRILAFNRVGAERSFAVFGRQMVVGEPLDAFVNPEDYPSYLDSMARALRGETAPMERSFALPDGTRRWYSIEFAPARADDGAVVGVCFTARDVSAQRQLQEQLFQAQKLEGIGRLAGGVAHDFNNLLVVITGCAELAMGELAPGHPARRDLGDLLRAAERAGDLTSRLLTFARRQSPVRTPTDLNQVIRGLRQLFQRLLRADIALTLDLDLGLPPVFADAGQIEQVLINLAVNAQDAMPHGGSLVVATASGPEGEVRLTVRDTGTGMSEEVARRAFEPFFTTKPPGEGTGLGLAVCYGIVSQHGGRITLDSRPGGGTAVTVALPVAPALPAAAAPAAAAPAPGGREHVLLVEDDAAVRSLAARVLRRRGYTVLEAHSGIEALGLTQEILAPVRLLVTDVVMPHLSGPALAALLVARSPGLRVLYMSGYSDIDLAAEQAAHPGLLLPKPFTPDALARAVRQALDG
jgi:PAS domain S-box-containing protein